MFSSEIISFIIISTCLFFIIYSPTVINYHLSDNVLSDLVIERILFFKVKAIISTRYERRNILSTNMRKKTYYEMCQFFLISHRFSALYIKIITTVIFDLKNQHSDFNDILIHLNHEATETINKYVPKSEMYIKIRNYRAIVGTTLRILIKVLNQDIAKLNKFIDIRVKNSNVL
uniref:Uncharacterized protein n=1 Tax=viral metagenome TaxID=1070528 RepID=A0A6C0LR41_9ZZZZ